LVPDLARLWRAAPRPAGRRRPNISAVCLRPPAFRFLPALLSGVPTDFRLL